MHWTLENFPLNFPKLVRKRIFTLLHVMAVHVRGLLFSFTPFAAECKRIDFRTTYVNTHWKYLIKKFALAAIRKGLINMPDKND